MDKSPDKAVRLTLLARSADNRVLGGVAGGLGARTGIEPDLIRAGFVVLTFAGGVGAVAYALAWMLSRDAEPHEVGPLEIHQQVATAILFAGSVLLLRSLGLWFGDRVVFPVALFAFGIAAITARKFGEDRDWTARITSESGAAARGRMAIGAVFIVGGVAFLLSSIDAIEQAGFVALAVAVTAAGLFLVLGPWIFRLADDVRAERRERIRSDERADMAAHLHDSVLQTLSLIQRTDDPRRMSTLARAQERELRSWLYRTEGRPGKVHAAIREQATRVEHEYDVPIEVVAVGEDAALTESTRALVDAAGEAVINAAKHSGSDKISIFVERDSEQIQVFISDQGAGFDPAAVGKDRHGIESSIEGRMRRSGGGAEILSKPGEGTEVRLWTRP